MESKLPRVGRKDGEKPAATPAALELPPLGAAPKLGDDDGGGIRRGGIVALLAALLAMLLGDPNSGLPCPCDARWLARWALSLGGGGGVMSPPPAGSSRMDDTSGTKGCIGAEDSRDARGTADGEGCCGPLEPPTGEERAASVCGGDPRALEGEATISAWIPLTLAAALAALVALVGDTSGETCTATRLPRVCGVVVVSVGRRLLLYSGLLGARLWRLGCEAWRCADAAEATAAAAAAAAALVAAPRSRAEGAPEPAPRDRAVGASPALL